MPEKRAKMSVKLEKPEPSKTMSLAPTTRKSNRIAQRRVKQKGVGLTQKQETSMVIVQEAVDEFMKTPAFKVWQKQAERERDN